MTAHPDGGPNAALLNALFGDGSLESVMSEAPVPLMDRLIPPPLKAISESECVEELGLATETAGDASCASEHSPSIVCSASEDSDRAIADPIQPVDRDRDNGAAAVGEEAYVEVRESAATWQIRRYGAQESVDVSDGIDLLDDLTLLGEPPNEPWLSDSDAHAFEHGISDEPLIENFGRATLDEVVLGAFNDPLADAGDLLERAGVGTSPDLRDVLTFLPPQLLTPRLLMRCLPGLAADWSRLHYLISDALGSIGHTLMPDPVDSVLPLLEADEAPPETIVTCDVDVDGLLEHEVRSIPLLTPAEQRVLGHWIAEGRLVEELVRQHEQRTGAPLLLSELVNLLVQEIAAYWRLVQGILPAEPASAAGWRGALVALSVIGVPDSGILSWTEIENQGGADKVRASLRRVEGCLRLMSDEALTCFAQILAVRGIPPQRIDLQAGADPDKTPMWYTTRAWSARQAMVRYNLRLVLAQSKRYASERHRLDLGDLVQEGSIGLIRAIEKWEPARGFAFSTYAIWWIRQGIIRAIADQGLTIRLPVHVQEHACKAIDGAVLTLLPCGAERFLPSEEEDVLLALTVSAPARQECHELLRQCDLSNESIRGAERALTLESLADEPLAQAELLIDDSEEAEPEAYAVASSLRTVLDTMLVTLKDREQCVIRLRFGLDDGADRTLEEVGREFGLTRERIRQIEAKAFRKLLHPSRSSQLRDYLPSIKSESPKLTDRKAKHKHECVQLPLLESNSTNGLSPEFPLKLTSLATDERVVICHRLGLLDGRPRSRMEVMESLKLPLVRVLWLENDALMDLSEFVGQRNGELFLRDAARCESTSC